MDEHGQIKHGRFLNLLILVLNIVLLIVLLAFPDGYP